MIPPPFEVATALKPAFEAHPYLIGSLMSGVMLAWFATFGAVARALMPHPRETVRHAAPTHREVVP